MRRKLIVIIQVDVPCSNLVLPKVGNRLLLGICCLAGSIEEGVGG